MFAYEAKKMAEKSPGVGMKLTNISIVNSDGIIEFGKDQIDKLDEIYKKWVKTLPKLSDFTNDIKELMKR